MTIPTQEIKELREATGAGIVDVKEALKEAQGDSAKAVEILRRRGKQVAEKKADRTAREGFIGSYVHANGKVAALVALACETDFVARTLAFQELAHNLALHVTAAAPDYLKSTDVPEAVLEKESSIIKEQMANENKPAKVIEKIVTGKLEKYFSDHCLLHQLFVKDDSMTITDLLEQATAKIGEKIEIRQFIRVQL